MMGEGLGIQSKKTFLGYFWNNSVGSLTVI